MEKYNQFDHHNSSQRRNFPAYSTSPPNPNPNHHPNMNINTFIQANPNYFQSPEFYSNQVTVVKREVAGTSQDQLNSTASRIFHNTSSDISNSKNEMEAMKAKIIDHPQYSNLLEAYIDCQKVGASPELAAKLSAIRQEYESRQRSLFSRRDSKDPELDQFMGSYYDMLVKYREELTRPVQEATEFMRRIESQLSLLSNGGSRIIPSDERSEGIGSSEDEQENSNGETELPEIDPRVEDRELKNRLLKKYSGCLSNLKQELSKKKKKGKLPKEARQKLLSWWELHYKWPYPSESEKLALAEATGLDQKQINNWFINQRKRHWKPSEDMQFMVMDGLHHPHTAAAFYMESHFTGNAPYRFGT